MDWYVFLGVLVWVTASFLTLCCLRMSDKADERIERMLERMDVQEEDNDGAG